MATATYAHPAIKIGDGKDIDLNGQSILGGSFIDTVEEYSNHLGAVDNFTAVSTTAPGTATTDAANHEMDLGGGNLPSGKASFQTKSAHALSSRPIIVNFKFNNYINGVDGDRELYLGLMETISLFIDGFVGFMAISTGQWKAMTATGIANATVTNIATPADGSLLSIMATSTQVIFFVNKVIVATHTTNIPSTAMYVASLVENTALGGAPTIPRSISIDFFSLKR